jgi:hypothetical protein
LVKAYAGQAERVSDPEIKRVLTQQSQESATHSQRFALALQKLGEAGEEPLVYEDSGELSPELVRRLQDETTVEYRLVLQHLRHAFVLESDHPELGELEIVAMRHMKHLSHFAEELAESGHEPQFELPDLDMSRAAEPALQSDLQLTREARERFTNLSQEPELEEHPGLKLEVENMISQEDFLAATIEELQEESGVDVESSAEAHIESQGETLGSTGNLTVGSLMKE